MNMIQGGGKKKTKNLSTKLHLHVLQAMGLVDPQYSHCFLAIEVDAGGVVVEEVTLDDPFSSATGSSEAGSAEGSDSATV